MIKTTVMTIAKTTTKQGTMSRDLANRWPDICWPEGFSSDRADLLSHNQLHRSVVRTCLEAHCRSDQMAAVASELKDVQIIAGGDELNAGSVFRWTAFGLPLASRVSEFTPYSRIGWYGYAPEEKPSFYHTWYLKANSDGCRVVTDEVGVGSSAAHLRESDESLIYRATTSD